MIVPLIGRSRMSVKPTARVLCIGEPLQESIATREADGSLSNVRGTGFAGDVAPNLAAYAKMAAEAYGADVQIDVLTALGGVNDPASNAAVADLAARGLGVHPATKRIEDKTMGTVANLRDPDGTPSAEKVRLNRKDSAFRDWLNDATDADLRAATKGYSHVVVSGIPLACVREREKLVTLLKYAKAEGAQIVVSTNLRPSNWLMPDNDYPHGHTADDPAWKTKAQHWLGKVIPLADMLLANATDEKTLRGIEDPKDVLNMLRASNPKAEIVVTDDANPVQLSYMSPFRQGTKFIDGKQVIGYEEVKGEFPIYPAAQVRDTVGAGDSLAATYLAARIARYVPEAALRLGSFVASQVVGIEGALPKHGDTSLRFTSAHMKHWLHAGAQQGRAI
jgi:2-dehydro-3-deoxygluconokinase